MGSGLWGPGCGVWVMGSGVERWGSGVWGLGTVVKTTCSEFSCEVQLPSIVLFGGWCLCLRLMLRRLTEEPAGGCEWTDLELFAWSRVEMLRFKV